MATLRSSAEPMTVDDWSRTQTRTMLPYEKLAALRKLLFYKLPSTKLMIAAKRKRSAYMETHVPSGPAADKVVGSRVLGEGMPDLEDEDDAADPPAGTGMAGSDLQDGLSIAVYFGVSASAVEKQSVALLAMDNDTYMHWLTTTGRRAAVDAATKAALESSQAGRRTRNAPAPPSVSDDDLRRWELELWQLECESRFQAGAAERGALSGDVTCIYVYALAPDDAVRGLLKVVVTAYEAFIDDVCVHPESYRLGVCYELCSRFATFAARAKLGCIGQTVRLQVRDSNTRSLCTRTRT